MAESVNFTFETEGSFPNIAQLSAQFPYLAKRLLARVGFAAARELGNNLMSGQTEIKFRSESFSRSSTGGMVTKKGKRMVSYAVASNAKHVKVKSFPLNLFEKGRTLRSGTKEKGRYILRNFGKNFNVSRASMEAFGDITKDFFEQAEQDARNWASQGTKLYGVTEDTLRTRFK